MGLTEDEVPWALCKALAPWDPFGGGALGALGPIWGGTLGALGPIWGGSSGRPKADIMEAEGRLNGGLGAEPPGILGFLFNA